MLKERMLEFICLSEILFNNCIEESIELDNFILANMQDRYKELAKEFVEKYVTVPAQK